MMKSDTVVEAKKDGSTNDTTQSEANNTVATAENTVVQPNAPETDSSSIGSFLGSSFKLGAILTAGSLAASIHPITAPLVLTTFAVSTAYGAGAVGTKRALCSIGSAAVDKIRRKKKKADK